MMGMEAGQSAFGDAYAWFKNMLAWPIQYLSANRQTICTRLRFDSKDRYRKFCRHLSREAEKITVRENSELAIDWFNGRRTPDANQELKGAITGINLASDAPAIFRAVTESTCFGAKAIVESLLQKAFL